jgi:hypothetical protein
LNTLIETEAIMSHSTTEQNFLKYHLNLLSAFIRHAQSLAPFNQDNCSEEDRAFFEALQLLSTSSSEPHFLSEGQDIMCSIVSRYPHLMPLLYRDLLWFFGGDCLHYMPDDEILKFQRLDELRHAASGNGELFSYENMRAQIFGMH